MKIELKSLPQQLQIFANSVAKEAKKYIEVHAKDTGDMMRAVSVSDVKESNGIYEIEVFVDPTKLYDKRIRYKSSSKKYPIFVHQGASYENRTLLARPYFTIAYEICRKQFTDIMPTIKVENDNK